MKKSILFLIIFYVFNNLAWSESESSPMRSFFAMGSEMMMSSDRNEVFYNEISKSLQNFEKNISTWNKRSDLSRFNHSSQVWFKFDQRSYQALKKTLACSQLTNGYFHPGLGQLIKLWGLREKINIPSIKEREAALASADLSTLAFNDTGLKIKKKNREFWFEEGGFAKGAAMDEIVKMAKNWQGEDLFLNFSGQIYSQKSRDVAIADPQKRDAPAIIITIENESVSTSGNSQQYFVHENISYGHILNPKIGAPLEHTLKSMTIIHPENIWADCLSTGLLAMSENKLEFKKWLKKHSKIKMIYLELVEGKLFAETSCGLKINKNLRVSQINENC